MRKAIRRANCEWCQGSFWWHPILVLTLVMGVVIGGCAGYAFGLVHGARAAIAKAEGH